MKESKKPVAGEIDRIEQFGSEAGNQSKVFGNFLAMVFAMVPESTEPTPIVEDFGDLAQNDDSRSQSRDTPTKYFPDIEAV